MSNTVLAPLVKIVTTVSDRDSLLETILCVLKDEKDPASVMFAKQHKGQVSDYWCAGRTQGGFYFDLVQLHDPNATNVEERGSSCVLGATCRVPDRHGFITVHCVSFSPKIYIHKKGRYCRYSCCCEDSGSICLHVEMLFEAFCKSNEGHCELYLPLDPMAGVNMWMQPL